MISNKKGVYPFLTFLRESGVKHFVVCPGSRNAPLILTLTEMEDVEIYSIPDERTAGFVSLGLSQSLQKPVAVITTSGSAVLNLAPAMAECYYSHGQIIVMTADRPAHLIDQGDGQSIRQREVFKNYCDYFFDMDLEIELDLQVCSEILASIKQNKGPVHINLCFNEPLYDLIAKPNDPPPLLKITDDIETAYSFTELQEKIDASKNPWIVLGQHPFTPALSELIASKISMSKVTLVTDPLSNLKGVDYLPASEALFSALRENKILSPPDLLIQMGDAVLCKQLKLYLRTVVPDDYYIIHPHRYPNVFQGKCTPVAGTVRDFFEVCHFTSSDELTLPNYKEKISYILKNAIDNQWGDARAFELLHHYLKDVTLHLGNSTPVRYAAWFTSWSEHEVFLYSNRGVSGIDGCTSTAVGWSMVSNRPNVLVTGDVSFFYDSNAFWVSPKPKNLLVIIINNNGGNIFDLIRGSELTSDQKLLQDTPPERDASKLVQQFGIPFSDIRTEDELVKALKKWNESDKRGVSVWQIRTDPIQNKKIYQEVNQKIKSIVV